MRQALVFVGINFLAFAAMAATTQTTLTVTDATVAISAAGITVNGPATLSGIGSGTFSLTGTTSNLSGTNATAPYTITLTTGDTITGTLTVPVSLIVGGQTSGSGSATVTGGTGAYANATGSFPNLNGSITGTIATGLKLSFTGPGSITTGGGGGGSGAPTITAVLDAGNYTANIAQGSIFVVKGTNMSAAGFVQASFPLPKTLNGVGINFAPSGGGTAVAALMVYVYNQSGVNQLAALLPSTVATGNYNVTVTNNGQTSAAFVVQVVARKPGLITQDSTGSGLAVVQNYISAAQLDVNRYTKGAVNGVTISPAYPGQVLIAWLVGLGAAPGDDSTASPGYDFTQHGVTVQAIVGGVTINALYGGRAPGLSGVDQVNFTLPANVPTGCVVPFQISVNGVLSQTGYIAIASDGSVSACVQPGFSTSQLQGLDNGQSVTTGVFSIIQLSQTFPGTGTVKLDNASGAFTRFNGDELAAVAAGSVGSLPSGTCLILQSASNPGQGITAVGTNLDAGAVTLDGPAGTNIVKMAFTKTNNVYSVGIGTEGLSVPLPGYGNGKLLAGTYTLNIGGGQDIGPTTASVTLGSPLSVTGGLPASVNRSAGVTLNWTGGNPTDFVEILGGTGTTTGSGANAVTTGTSFLCVTTAGAQSFTVPANITSQLQQVTADQEANGSGVGFLSILSGVNPTSGNGLFSAPLTAGGSIASTFTALVGQSQQVAFQ